jgi:hypothetical protein
VTDHVRAALAERTDDEAQQRRLIRILLDTRDRRRGVARVLLEHADDLLERIAREPDYVLTGQEDPDLAEVRECIHAALEELEANAGEDEP